MSQTARLLQALQTRVAELERENEQLRQHVSNSSLEHRLLEATAMAANTLLTIANFDEAVNTALQIIGESLDTDRVAVIENFAPSSDLAPVEWRVLYEWNSPYAVSQISHPELSQGTWEGIEEWYEITSRGQGISRLLEEMPEPFRSGQAKLGLKALHIVPIFVEGTYWGTVGFDDCRAAKQRSLAELSVLRIAADCIGSAIQRDRTQQAMRQAEQARSAELEKVNAALEVEVIARSQAEQLARGQTEALIKILAGLAAEPNLDSFLGNALRALAEQLGERSAGLWLYDDSHDATILHLNYESGTVHRGAQTNRPAASIHRPLKGWDVEYLAALRQQKVLIHTEQEFAQSPGYATSRASYSDRGIKTVLYVSLFFGDRFLGFITIRSTQTRHYPSEEVKLARVLAYQVALAIQLTQLAKQAQQSAVLEERNRLARDIHDTLAQVLTGVIVQLQAAENPYTTDPHDRQEHLAQAHLLAKQGLSEARRSIRALRSQILEATDFASALTDLAEQMAIGNGLQVNCQIEAAPYWLEPDVESHLFRIAQEAMTNTLKHAQANTLHLKLVYEPSQVQLQVEDNGQGFDPTITSVGGYGVIGMQERSQQIGAQFQLTSRVGQGTIVRVIVPIFTPTSTRSLP